MPCILFFRILLGCLYDILIWSIISYCYISGRFYHIKITCIYLSKIFLNFCFCLQSMPTKGLNNPSDKRDAIKQILFDNTVMTHGLYYLFFSFCYPTQILSFTSNSFNFGERLNLLLLLGEIFFLFKIYIENYTVQIFYY